jgi:hypothetical protein
MAYDITNEAPLSIATTPAARFRFTDATVTTAWTDSTLGAAGIKFLRVVVYATAASAAQFSVEVADNGSGTNPILVSIVTPATSVASALEFRCVVPVSGKVFFRVVRAGTSATFDALAEVV